jgi:hypothetical protein
MSCTRIPTFAGEDAAQSTARPPRRMPRNMRQEGVHPVQFMAFPFTERAAASLKNRITRRIVESMGEAFLDRLSPMFVGTIHTYCLHLLQDHMLGIDAAVQSTDACKPKSPARSGPTHRRSCFGRCDRRRLTELRCARRWDRRGPNRRAKRARSQCRRSLTLVDNSLNPVAMRTMPLSQPLRDPHARRYRGPLRV